MTARERPNERRRLGGALVDPNARDIGRAEYCMPAPHGTPTQESGTIF